MHTCHIMCILIVYNNIIFILYVNNDNIYVYNNAN